MAYRPLIVGALCFVLVGRLAAAPATPADKMSGLLTNSPFGTAKSGAAGGNSSGEPFEFRAFLEENGRMFFSIFETSTRRSNWVELNDPVNGLSVKGYDAAKESVTIDYQGKAMTLAIKRAPAVAQVMQQGPMPGPMLLPNNQPGAGPVLQAGPSATDQQRIQQIQEEIRRRRALRNQPMMPAVGPNGQPISGAGPQMQPSNSPGPIPQPSTSSGPQPLPQTN